MKYIEALEEYEYNEGDISVFIAGGITNCPNWQKYLAKLLEDDDIIILNPRRKNFNFHDKATLLEEAMKQIEWEFRHFKKATIISFWFSIGSSNPIVLFELGKWLKQKEKPILIGIDPEYSRKTDVIIQTRLEREDIKIVDSILDLSKKIRKTYKKLMNKKEN